LPRDLRSLHIPPCISMIPARMQMIMPNIALAIIMAIVHVSGIVCQDWRNQEVADLMEPIAQKEGRYSRESRDRISISKFVTREPRMRLVK